MTGARSLAARPFLLGFACAALASVAAAAVLARLYPGFQDWIGSESFARIARQLARGGLYSADGRTPTLERMPLYPWILALAMRLGGGAWRVWAVGLNAVAFATAAGLAASLAARFSRSAGAVWACALLLAGHAALAAEALAFRETAWVALALAALAFALTGDRVGPARLVAAGLAAGAGYLLRPTGFLLVAVLPLWLWAVRRSLVSGWFASAALALGVAALAILPWQIYALRHFGRPILEDTEGGNTALKGALPEYWTMTPWMDYDDLDPWLASSAVARYGGQNGLERDRAWRAETLRAIEASPAGWLAKAGCKIAVLYCPVSVPLGYGRIVPRGDTVAIEDFRLDPWAFASVPAATLILVGAAARFRRSREVGAGERGFLFGLAFLLAGLTAIHAVTLSETRYRLPFDPLLAVPAALALSGWAGRQKFRFLSSRQTTG